MSTNDHTTLIRSCYERIQNIAHKTNLTSHKYGTVENWELFAFITATPKPNAPWIYLSAGVHGDEPAAVLALIEFWESNQFNDHFNWIICPIINPIGLIHGTRENGQDIDLNRDYRNPQTIEIKSHTEWLSLKTPKQGFEISICLHEDWEATGPYLYFLSKSEDASLARSTLHAMNKILPIDTSEEIDGMAANQGLILASEGIEQYREERSDWPEAFFLWPHSRYSMTIETPSGLPMTARITAHSAALEAIIQELPSEG